MGKNRLLFLDEVVMCLDEAPRTTVVLPCEETYVFATDTTSYAHRFDTINHGG